ncbi:MAG: hypothetical protein C0478_16055 [Planctomyces sp.]|nr:hypothetical protein [Planctomyces sp.]
MADDFPSAVWLRRSKPRLLPSKIKQIERLEIDAARYNAQEGREGLDDRIGNTATLSMNPEQQAEFQILRYFSGVY